jgi:hypothetical protein
MASREVARVRMDFFGDSYDVVKRYLLHTMAPGAVWQAFPMFTGEVTEPEVAELEAFLGVKVAASSTLAVQTDRAAYLRADQSWTHIFLDPDTGVRLGPCGGERSTHYVFAQELLDLCHQRPDRLVMVFDQSLARGRTEQDTNTKLDYFAANGVFGFAYHSHACFIVLSATQSGVDLARDRVVASHMPLARLVPRPRV